MLNNRRHGREYAQPGAEGCQRPNMLQRGDYIPRYKGLYIARSNHCGGLLSAIES